MPPSRARLRTDPNGVGNSENRIVAGKKVVAQGSYKAMQALMRLYEPTPRRGYDGEDLGECYCGSLSCNGSDDQLPHIYYD